MADADIDENLAMDFQNLISCIECHKEEKNVEVTFETLKTIVNICAEEEIGKDAFRDVGGLDFLLQLTIDTDQLLILESCLKTLAFVIDKNVHSQMYMTQERVFRIISAIIEKKTYPLSVLKNAIILFSTLLYQNRGAQDMIQENSCLLSLINLYKRFSPVSAHHSDPLQDSEHLELWLHINSTLCFVVNNPLHEKNQSISCELFPLSIKIIEALSNPVIIKAAASFLSLSVANNEKNQDSFAEMDGFFMLKRSLSQTVEEIQSCIRECNNVIKKDNLDILNALISIVSAAVFDHGKNASLCGKLGIVSLLTQLLIEVPLDSSSTTKILLVLSNCIEAYSENKLVLLQTPKLDIFLKKNLETNDSELQSAAKYLLQVCLIDFKEENDENENFCSHKYDSVAGFCQHSCKRHDKTKHNASQQSRNRNDLTKILEAQNSSSSEEDSPDFNVMDFQTKCEPNTSCKIHHSCNCIQEDDGWSESDSDSFGDTSLHSAQHLFMLKMNGKDQKIPFGPNRAKPMNHGTEDTLCLTNAESEMNNFDIRRIEIDCLMTKKTASKNIFSKDHLGSRKSENLMQNITLQNVEHVKSGAKKSNNLESSHSSRLAVNSKQMCSKSKGNYDKRALFLSEDTWVNSAQNKLRVTGKEVNHFGTKGLETDCLMPQKTSLENSFEFFPCSSRKLDDPIEKCSLERDKKEKHKGKKRKKQNLLKLPTNSKQELNAGTGMNCNKNQYSTDKKASSLSEDTQMYSEQRKLKETGKKRQSTKPYSSSLHDSSPHHPKNKKVHSSAAGSSRKSHPPNTEGCVEVIVLPGAGCPEHKLTAQFDLLRVCPLKTNERRIS